MRGEGEIGGAGGCVVEGACAGGLAVQAPPHACQELPGEGLEIQHGSGLVLQGVEVEAGLASYSPDPGPCVKGLSKLPIVGVEVVVVQDH